LRVFAESEDLVASPGERQPLRGRVRGDLGGPPPHPLDRPQQGAGEEVAEQGRKHQRDRSAEQQTFEQAGQGVVAVLERRADDHGPALGGGDQQPVGAVFETSDIALDESLPRGRRRERRPEPLNHLPVRAEHLRDDLLLLDERAGARRFGLCAQACFELLVQRVAQLEVDERSHCGKHHRQRRREGKAEAKPDREAVHSARSR
jgi:hypothetical protein